MPTQDMRQRGSKLQPFALSALGGALTSFAFPSLGWIILSFVGLVPLFLVLENVNSKQAFWRGYVFGLAFGLPNLIWLQQFVGKWTGSWWLGAIPWLVVCVLFAIYFGLFSIGAAKAWNRGAFWAIPLIWSGVEFARSIVPYLYFPWSQLGTSLYSVPILLQPAWWGGIYFLSAWLVLFNVVIAMLIRRKEPRSVRPYLFVTLLVLGGSVVSYQYDPPAATRWLVAAQPGVDLAFGEEQANILALSEKVPEVMRMGQAVRRDLLVLPEHLAEGYGDSPPVGPFEWVYEVPFVVGAQRNTDWGAYQSLYGWDGEWKYADKLRLVIFGEYVPFRDKLERYLGAFNLPSGDLRFADRITTLEVAGLKVGGLVCFEGLFEEVARKHASNGAHILALSSIDDWYQGTNAIEALKAGAVLRAVENRLPLVKSSPLGPSFVVDGRGNVVAITSVGRTAIARAEVKIGPRPVSPLRHAFPWVCLGVWIVFSMLPTKRSNETSVEIRT